VPQRKGTARSLARTSGLRFLWLRLEWLPRDGTTSLEHL
jgi:hypothetical protein